MQWHLEGEERDLLCLKVGWVSAYPVLASDGSLDLPLPEVMDLIQGQEDTTLSWIIFLAVLLISLVKQDSRDSRKYTFTFLFGLKALMIKFR